MEAKAIKKCPDGLSRRVFSCDYYKKHGCENCPYKEKSKRFKSLPNAKYGKKPKKKLHIINQEDLSYLEKIKARTVTDIEAKRIDCLINHLNHGASLSTINKALMSIGDRIYEKTGDFAIFGGKGSNYFKNERKVKLIINLLNKLEPVMEEFTEGHRINEWLKDASKKLEQYLELLLIQKCRQLWNGTIIMSNYDRELMRLFKELDDPEFQDEVRKHFDEKLEIFKSIYPKKILRDFLKRDKIKQSQHYYFDFAIKTLVEEFKRIYGTDNTAYKETANLLNLFLPEIFKSSPKHIAKRYKLLKNKKI